MKFREGSSLKLAGLFIFLLTFILTIHLSYKHNKDKDIEKLKILSSSFELTVNNSVSNFAWDYVQWMPFQTVIAENESSLIGELFRAAELEKKYIDKVLIVSRPKNLPEDADYEIRVSRNEVIAYLNLFDRNHMNFKRERVVMLKINENNILEDLNNNPKDFYLASDGRLPFAFGLRVKQASLYISPIEVFFSFIVSLGLVTILGYLYNFLFNFQWKTTGLEKIMFLLESRDGYTINHSRNVSVIARLIAEELSYPKRELLRIEAAAKLHDIGKLAVPSEILNKCEKLDTDECKVIKKHPGYGMDLIRHFREFEDLLPGILYHHERLDGSGYPLGLEGNRIPLIAQIIAVADVFEAMTSDRPYRKAIRPEIVIKLMKNMPLNQKFVSILENNRDKIVDMITVEMSETPSFEMEFAKK